MKVMPSVLGQVGQNVADELFELGKSAVQGTVKAVADVASESIEQITAAAPGQVMPKATEKTKTADDRVAEKNKIKAEEKRRFDEVRAELDRYINWKKQQDQKIAQEKAAQNQQEHQEKAVEKQKKDSWVKNMINRSQTGTEKGRLQE